MFSTFETCPPAPSREKQLKKQLATTDVIWPCHVPFLAMKWVPVGTGVASPTAPETLAGEEADLVIRDHQQSGVGGERGNVCEVDPPLVE
jgi:hypothetical protein